MTKPMIGRTARLLLAFALVAGVGLGVRSPVAAAGSFVDVAASPFRGDIEWLASRGITAGCDRDRYCPDAPMTREQMASMLVRMFSLPSTDHDYFADDAGSAHEANINRLAAAGIAAGCGAERFCPRAPVSRAQMASFLVRAADIGGAAPDYFLDDDRSVHRGDIDRAAMAGITAGCHQYVFCSSMAVTRGQMAAFLRRVEQPISPPAPLPDVGPLPACRYDDVLTPHAATEDWQRTVLDTIYALPASYGPGALVDSGSAGL
ncbi:MAG: S-layer homology domain-containing protein, partial [Candidatus Limnocylindria bacterium]